MGTEIERKFLVKDDGWRGEITASRHLRQAYLAQTPALTLRVRIVDEEQATMNLKSSQSGIARQEFEYAIPLEDARALMALALGRPVVKRRHIVAAGALAWEIDVFEGDHAGLILAEIELPHAEADFPRPAWLGDEVTDDPRYYNAALAGLSGAAGT